MWQTIGHEWAVTYLQKALTRGKVAQAILFTGPQGVGKTHLALELAAALLCHNPNPPCDACWDCSHARALKHPDLLFMEPQEGSFKIDQVRSIQHALSLKPYAGLWKVCVLSEFQTATPEAANALLKTLEEPPPYAILLLTALDAALLLPTIVSRCQILSLHPIPIETIAQALMAKYGIEAEHAQMIARLSGGRIGWAIRAVQAPQLLEEHEASVQALFDALSGGVWARLALAEATAKQANIAETLYRWQTIWRDVMLLASGCPETMVINQKHLPTLKRLAKRYGIAGAKAAAARSQEALLHLEQNVNPRLALETLLLDWNV